MTVTPIPNPPSNPIATFTVRWEKLPDDFKLDNPPVDNTGQPLLAAALRESLEITGRIQPEMLIAGNFGLCATLNDTLVIKAPDWLYIPRVTEPQPTLTRKSYTPNLEGENPCIVMEFLSDKDDEEYSVRRVPPIGKWFFYEQVLKIPTYVVFEPEGGLLEVYRLKNDRYELEQPDFNGRHWIEELGLFLGTWRGLKVDRDGDWLRWWDQQEQILPWAIEQIEAERQRADRLADYLRSQGIDPNTL
jgi:Putative restriction endonuclease